MRNILQPLHFDTNKTEKLTKLTVCFVLFNGLILTKHNITTIHIILHIRFHGFFTFYSQINEVIHELNFQRICLAL